MPRYVALNIGGSEDEPRCYNSIGCDLNWWFFEADNMEEAKIKAIKGKYWDDEEGEFVYDLHKIYVLQYDNTVSIDEYTINKFRDELQIEWEEKQKELEKIREKQEEDEKVAKELELLDSLQKKYASKKA